MRPASLPWPKAAQPCQGFNFEDRGCYIEVTLSKTAVAGLAQLGAVWLKPTECLIGP